MLKNFDKNQNYYKFYKRKNIPIVFIHGVGLDHEMWFPQIRSFKNRHLERVDHELARFLLFSLCTEEQSH